MKITSISANFTTNRVNRSKSNPQTSITIQPISYDSFEVPKNRYNTVSFTGVDGKGKVKQRGMMFHITSLPATRSYCGQFLDPETDKFINFLSEAKQTHWIMNPLFALENDLCPYNASGRFSKNKYLVNLNELTKEKYGKLLKTSELPDDVTSPVFTLDMLKTQKDPRFKLAFERFKELPSSHPIKTEYKNFEKENGKLWLDTYSAHSAITKVYGNNWKKWPDELKNLPEDAKKNNTSLKNQLKTYLIENSEDKTSSKQILEDIDLYKFEQFLYDKQFNEFKDQLAAKGIRLILDLAIGVSPNGVDTWANKVIFLMDENNTPTKVSGAPPESAYPYTQVWGHALYNYDAPEFWDYQENSLRKLLREGDLRLDHFAGYINRAEIPTSYTTEDGRVLKGNEIFKSKEQGGMGKDFFEPDWIVRIDKKHNSRGENMFELFKRVAKEEGLVPEDCYILEDFGPLAETEAYNEFREKYGKNFISQRVPVAMGIGESIEKAHEKNSSSPEAVKLQKDIAILTGNHDLPPLKDYIDTLLDGEPEELADGKNSPALFRDFCKEELKLTEDEMKDRDLIAKEIMKWYYTRDAKQVQTTLQDALGLYYRPNIPGYWNGMQDKYLMKTTPQALLPFWSRVFPKGFLERTDKSGINPGYKDLADNFIKMMNELFSNNKTDKN